MRTEKFETWYDGTKYRIVTYNKSLANKLNKFTSRYNLPIKEGEEPLFILEKKYLGYFAEMLGKNIDHGFVVNAIINSDQN